MAVPVKTNTAVSSGASSGTSITISCTVADNPYRMLLVFYSSRDGGQATSATYGGVSMTKGAAFGAVAGFHFSYYYLLAPAVGTADLTVNWTGASVDSGISAIVLSGCSQVAPNVDKYSGAGSGTSISDSVTTTSYDNLVLMYNPVAAGATTFTGRNGAAVEVTTTFGSFVDYAEISSLSQASPGAQTRTLSWTNSRANDWAIVAIAGVNGTLTAAQGSFTLTGYTMSFGRMAAAVGSFALTGVNAAMTFNRNMWDNVSKTVTSWTNRQSS